MNGIFDSHAHYFDARFDRETDGGADGILHSILPEPVAHILNVGTNCRNSQTAIRQAARYVGMYAAAGIHPEDCHFAGNPADALNDLCRILGDPESRKRDKLVAIGEIGLDYHTERFGEIPLNKSLETEFFDAQLELAEKLDLPVIIHDRDAHGDCFDAVLRHPHVRGVFHSYSGSPEMAKELVRRGWYLSFSGTLTFRNAAKVRESALTVPHDRLLVETDAPYLAPHPFRGSLNHSGYLTHTLQTLAELWQCSPQSAADQTAENAKTLFHI